MCTINGLWDKNAEKNITENKGKKEVRKRRKKKYSRSRRGGKFLARGEWERQIRNKTTIDC